jgi:cytochrome c
MVCAIKPAITPKSCGLVIAIVWFVLLHIGPVLAQLQGHGGPVRALAVSRDGGAALSGSFDSTAIVWDLRRDTAKAVLRLHDGAVNAVALGNEARAITAGEDGRIALWTSGRTAPNMVLTGHTGPIAALAVSPDGETLASASWDGTVRLWHLAGGQSVVLQGHAQNVNGVAFMPDGKAVVSAGYDATVRIWPLAQPSMPIVTTLPAPLNAVAVAPDGEISVAAADGHLYFLSPAGASRDAVAASPAPVIALAMSRNGIRIAAASINGAVAILDRKTRNMTARLTGPGMPVWSVAFSPDGRTLLTGGADGMIRRWDAETGQAVDPVVAGTVEDPLAAYAGEPGAQVFRACVACHTLQASAGNRAGPSLYGLFGRRIASLPGYNYSEGLRHLDIVWTRETVAKLFEIGPAHYTPGTKMPEQRISAPEDREALVKFLEKATR